jgi:hypothetical protein
MGNRGLLAGQTVREEVMARRVGIVGIGTAMMRNLVKDITTVFALGLGRATKSLLDLQQ